MADKQPTFDQAAAEIAARIHREFSRLSDIARDHLRADCKATAAHFGWHRPALFAAALWKAEDLFAAHSIQAKGENARWSRRVHRCGDRRQ